MGRLVVAEGEAHQFATTEARRVQDDDAEAATSRCKGDALCGARPSAAASRRMISASEKI